ncbi:aromatic ring-hydroxylating oxygenase subunit alpha [Amaricoccus solimangrovi]|uniref:Aromatic ring-hydroxylating dioxygenase subunit alpha n=1 Tax=Amaricoccus solimangrovi TaxID=2589815 RepID=A0A501WHX5_9RHOB|nr:aromatic ring-hydroxylating dioxygenase subunit alpha [Amaricoccus solimangrovi]TPE47714.1 aromatic ring-hydroxylating dioxygenase subunit alpha [Amaricoccus solimangrovi]
MSEPARIESLEKWAPERILAAVHGGRGQTLADAETLPPAAYTTEAFFALERERIFRPGWMVVGHVAQIPEVGDYFTLDLLGEPMVVVRGPDRIRVMSRVCLHRWAPVVSGAGNAKMFSCPFHRWGYDLTGQLKAAPFMDQALGFDPKKCRLPEIRSEIVLGSIYVNLSGDAEPLGPRMDGLAREFANIPMDELVVGYSTEFPCPFNWKIAVETFMECYHHIGAHAKTLQPHHPGGESWGLVKEDPEQGWIGLRHPLRADLPTEAALAPGLPVFADWTEEQIRTGNLYHVFPNHLMGTSANSVRWTTILPKSAGETWWIRHHLVHRSALENPEFADLMAQAKEKGAVIAREDVEVNTLQQIGAKSRLAGPGRLSHLEMPVWQLADWVRDGIGESV